MKLKYKLMLAILAISIGICLMTYQSYALWVASFTGGENIVEVGCFSIDFKEITSPISLNNTYPMSDQKGMSGTAYQFTITNTCSIDSSYQVTLNTLTTNEITKDKIKYAIYKSNETKPTTGINIKNAVVNNDTSNLNIAKLDESFLIASGNLKEQQSVTYNYYMWIDETAGNEVMNKSFEASINIVTAATTISSKATEYITELAKTDTTNLAYDNTTDNNLRYIGIDPNNYVMFNNELWRIIGVMNNVDDGSGNKESRLKIVRNEKIGGYMWDSSASDINQGQGINEWSQADINILLNDYYYNAKSDQRCYTGFNNATEACDFSSNGLQTAAKELIGPAVWNLGSNGSKTLSSVSAFEFYELERSSNTGKMCSSGVFCNDDVIRTSTWTGNIGLQYPSDLGLATSGGKTISREECVKREESGQLEGCLDNSWTSHRINNYTISPFSESGSEVIMQKYSLYISTSLSEFSGAIYPTLYLKKEVKIIGGTGSSTEPYLLSLV